MCGIAAIVSDGPEIPPMAIDRMVESQAHRGPDGQASICLPGCHLGHARLSVIDLLGGAQPMTEDSGRFWITFNGEIYNYRELRRDLEKRGWRFRTQSDTEVLLRAYQEYGQDVLAHLNGQFAFAIWDCTQRRLFAARDRLGEKPLYWAHTDRGHLLLASEIKALLASGLLVPRIDRLSVDAYLALLYVPPDRTIYENVHTLRPGHALCVESGRRREWPYWLPAYSQAQVSDPVETIRELRALLSQAVKRQMVADVPVGAFLSGGLDSSTIVALMAQHTDRGVMTFSVGFGELINELPYAKAVAESYHTAHHEIQMDICVEEMLERMSEVYDEPFADSSNIPTYLLAEFARRQVKVVLSGDGGDELFGGYEWYTRLLDDSAPNPRAAAVFLLRLRAFIWRGLAKAGLPYRWRRDAAIAAYELANARRRYPDSWQRHLAFVTSLQQDRSPLWDGGAPGEAAEAMRRIYEPSTSVQGIDRAVDFDVRCYLPGDILVKVDRAAMAHGLETRAPFLDVDLVEYVLRLPWAVRFQEGKQKALLKESCSDLWPEIVRRRNKQGFGAPIWDWLQRRGVQALLQRTCALGSPLTALLPGVRSGLTRWSPQQQWTILCLGLWLERRRECLHNLS